MKAFQQSSPNHITNTVNEGHRIVTVMVSMNEYNDGMSNEGNNNVINSFHHQPNGITTSSNE